MFFEIPFYISKALIYILQVRQKPPAGRSGRQQPAGSGGGGSSSNSVSGGGGSSGASSSSSSTRASPAGTIRAPTGQHGRPALASNFSLDDITAQLEKVRESGVITYIYIYDKDFSKMSKKPKKIFHIY